MSDELAEHLDSLARDVCYRVDAVLKQSPFETTERVFFQGENGSELGPFVRKRIDRESGVGLAYECICAAQKAGQRFMYLPRVIECYTVGDNLVVVMEHVGGETLHEVVYRCDPSVELARDVFPRLCDATTELHRGFDVPLIHRDLKPSNVMLSRDSLTIIDFGIARSYKEEREEDTCHFGTRAYAPPEQFGYGQTDVRSDVYALGLLLYFCLTEKTPDARMRKNEFRAMGIPEDVRLVILKATAFNPADRYKSAEELKQAFLSAMRISAHAIDWKKHPVSYRLPDELRDRVIQTARPRNQLLSETEPPFLYHSDTPPSGKVRGSRMPRTTVGRLLYRIPFVLGVVWDVLLGVFFAIFCGVAANSTINPAVDSAESAAPLWLRAISYGSMVLLIIGPVLYLTSDRRPLARMVPRLARMPIERDMATCFIIFLIGFVLFGVSGQFMPTR